MRLLRKVLVVIASVVGASVVVLGVAVYFGLNAMCGNEYLAELPSPDGEFKAIVFQRDCGVTTGFSTQVSIVGAAASLGNSVGNVFVSDTNHAAVSSGPVGGPSVQVAWRSSGVLVISHPRLARVFKAEPEFGAVEVQYEQVAELHGGSQVGRAK